MAYSKTALKALWVAAGGSAKDAEIAAAIALSESSGNPNATGPDGDCGLWQIHPPQANCHNPQANARMAVAKKQSQGWQAWTDYKNGNYLKHMGNGTTAGTDAQNVGFPDVTPWDGISPLPDLPGAGDVIGAIPGLKEIADVFKTMLQVLKALFDKDTWYRVGKVGLGYFLVVWGVMLLGVIAINLLTSKSAKITNPGAKAVQSTKSAADKAKKAVDAASNIPIPQAKAGKLAKVVT